jgi:hypothetical protein
MIGYQKMQSKDGKRSGEKTDSSARHSIRDRSRGDCSRAPSTALTTLETPYIDEGHVRSNSRRI